MKCWAAGKMGSAARNNIHATFQALATTPQLAMSPPMKLTDEQQSTVRAWAEAGATLNDIQNQLRDEMGIRMTFMDVRFLILDLNITLKPDPVEEETKPEPEEEIFNDTPEGLQVTVDEITIPGTMASGKVTFTDGVQANWFIDPTGRFGLQAPQPGYQPPPDDVPLFQQLLQAELRRMGMY